MTWLFNTLVNWLSQIFSWVMSGLIYLVMGIVQFVFNPLIHAALGDALANRFTSNLATILTSMGKAMAVGLWFLSPWIDQSVLVLLVQAVLSFYMLTFMVKMFFYLKGHLPFLNSGH